eukprot:CAMPEP_0179428300 /NCGR_PEP_ID=MMETSP0799-20121207/14013_1 /TAXON_ID=46947 /ORGANISM="Geminigera cryophila, Strain CCMP2564" /LENGTH=56 /DNA_ID=CAMNT_0021203739 /DNA_START=575 /DNA_END=745 /DNA_ORIENTATION=-
MKKIDEQHARAEGVGVTHASGRVMSHMYESCLGKSIDLLGARECDARGEGVGMTHG